MKTYTTIAGDTWDIIAYKVYGDDKDFERIIDANLSHIDTLLFSAGVKLNIPTEDESNTTDTEEVDSDAALWRESMNE